jgi:predicted nucleic acid-binding protein
MENKRVIPDANVFLEFIYNRRYHQKALRIIEDAITGKVKLLAPSLLLDEITEVLCGNLENVNQIEQHIQFLEQLIQKDILKIIVPNTRVRMKAIEIARIGNKKSGYPELSDSLYHALAILNEAVFVTNDIKHYSKVKLHGHISQLGKY